MRHAPVLALAVALVAADASAIDVQYGLRLDSMSSLQWTGSTIYALGPQTGTLATSQGPILGIWAGPLSGTFALQTERTLGLLVGRDVQPLVTVGPGMIVRTSRPDTAWVGRTEHATAGPRLRIHEMRGASMGREVVETAGELVDFDVSALGSVIYLMPDRRAYLSVSGTTKPITFPQAMARAQAIRIFIGRDEQAVSLLFPDALCTATADRREWRCDPFDPARQAVVRQAWDGHVTLEPRATR